MIHSPQAQKKRGTESGTTLLVSVYEEIIVSESLEAYAGTILGVYATKNGPIQLVYHFASSEDLDARLSRAYAAVFDMALERWKKRQEASANIRYKM